MRAVIPLIAFALIALVAYVPANVVTVSSPAQADTTWTWPENPENLQVLPEDIGAFRLGQIMRGFTRALGIRCQHCHVGTEEMSLSEFDFVSDSNIHKQIARDMMRMTGAINNELLAGIDGLHEAEGMRVTCYTCHRGDATPVTAAPSREFMPRSDDEDRHDGDHHHEGDEDPDHGDGHEHEDGEDHDRDGEGERYLFAH